MTNQPIRHRVIRTNNKHSRAICKENTIIIRLARDLTQEEEEDHIQCLLKRMEKLTQEEDSKVLLHPFEQLLNGAQEDTITFSTGRKETIRMLAGKRLGAKKTETGWNITVGPDTRRAALHRFLWKTVSLHELARISTLVHHLNERTFKERISNVVLQFAKTQWGSCSSSGTIMINAALLFAPSSLLHYVIIHELAHLRIQDHSKAYWKLVEKMMPEYKKAYNAMKQYRLPTL